tara:strand:- start:323 stop:523 length:201 start_codon:yes stop_codon:yes gene_type:complete
MNNYIIAVNRVTEVTLPIEVKANDEEEAQRLAIELAQEKPSHYWSTLHDQDIDKTDLYVDSVTFFG